MTTAPILIVDDNRDACTVAARLLRSYGYEADVAYDGESALKLADQNFYALAIIDYQMPGMNGVELFRQRFTPEIEALKGGSRPDQVEGLRRAAFSRNRHSGVGLVHTQLTQLEEEARRVGQQDA